ncbi:MAG: hypothetical protein V2I41_04170, partial [Pseudomonadales bacterium]|nr:hypothetical protein [Pseudomonadales bacterium]
MFVEDVSLPDDLVDRDLFAAQLNDIYGQDKGARIIAWLAKDHTRAYWHNPLQPGATLTIGD